jgi:peroxiredoxin
VLSLPVLALLAVPGFAQLSAPAAPDTSPAVGAMAPDFDMPDGTSIEVDRLSDFRGKKKVLLMFFPGAFTRGCTVEFTEAGQFHDRFVEMNIELIGISRDLPGALAAFKESVGAQNAFLSDADLNVTRLYGAGPNARGVASRFYFLIDEQGRIAWKNTANQLIPTETLLSQLSTVSSASR